MSGFFLNLYKYKTMKRVFFLLLFGFFVISCKKDSVDATTTKTLQSSINDMTSSLNTLQQVKFNEALYILKTFGVEADGDVDELKALGKLINGKKVPEIFSMADQVAQTNSIDWTSKGPPSLGEMNIFGNEMVKESDPNDISAASITLDTKQLSVDSVLGAKAIQIIPRLIDRAGKPIVFEGAGLEATMEVFSNGTKISTAKNLMQDNNFKGFNLKFASLPAQRIVDNKIDITVSVKTTKKTFKMSKIGVAVNPNALLAPVVSPIEPTPIEGTEPIDPTTTPTTGTSTQPTTNPPPADPKNSVTKFLNNLSSQNLKAAYETAENPNWGSYENFSNPTSGFGGVKSINVKNMTTKNTSANSASVNATYDVTDKSGKTTALQVTFGLKNVNGNWKISSYKIN